MDGYIKIAATGDVPPNTKRTVRAAGKAFMVANVGGEFFVSDDTCTHEQCSLGTEGFLDGTVLICGCHGATFDVPSGRVLSLPATTDLSIYGVKVQNGEIYIKA